MNFESLWSVREQLMPSARSLTTDPQLADRFEALELPHWHNDEAFSRLLASFEVVLPLQKAPI